MTYANVMATVAVFIALGGSSYAVARLGANSVGSRQIAPNAVKRSEIAKSAVESEEVRNGSLRAQDFARLPAGPRGDRGAVGTRGSKGSQGERGAAGARGPAGADAATNLLVRLGASVDLAVDGAMTLQAACNAGERAVSGGASFQPAGDAAFAEITSSYPGPNTEGSTPTSWSVGVHNKGGHIGNMQFQSYAVCVSP